MKRLSALLVAIAVLCTGPVPLRAQTNPNTLNTLDRRLVRYAQLTLTNAQVLLLGSTPVTVIPAQGAGTVIEPLGGIILFNYTATYSNGSNLKLWYTTRTSGPAASPAITVSGLLTGVSADHAQFFAGVPDGETPSASGNEGITVMGTTPTAFTGGNASNTVTIRVAYRVHNTGF